MNNQTVDRSKFYKIYCLSAPSGRGKDMVLSAAFLMACRQLGVQPRFTNRPLREGDHYFSATLEEMRAWERDGETDGPLFNPYKDTYFTTKCPLLDEQLISKPLLCHYLPSGATDMLVLGYQLVLSRLIVVNRQPHQELERMREREAQDRAFQLEIDKRADLFVGHPDIVNDFALTSDSGLKDEWNRPIPLGAARAALRWLDFIATEEKWEKGFLRPYFQKLNML